MAPLWRVFARLLAVALLLAVSVSCDLQWKGGKSRSGRGVAPFADGDRWRPGPASIRIYPSSRLAVHDGQWFLEGFVELLDDMGDSVKGVGTLQFELFRATTLETEGPGQRLYVWNVRLHTLADQQRHYDATLRTYQFRLKIYALPNDVEEVVLRVMYENEEGYRMDAEARLPGRIEG